MSPWLESLAVVAIALSAFLLGRWFSRLPRSWWVMGYFIPLGCIVLYCLAMFEPRLGLLPPLRWMTIGRSRFVWFNFIAVLMLTTPLSRIPQKHSRGVLYALMVALTAVAVVPFLAPAFNRGYLAGLRTRLDANGICRQSNDYTCGPAAAVTALRKLGFPGEEGEIAILAHTSLLTGTEPDVLANVLQKRYGAEGLVAEYRAFKDIAELKQAGLTVAVVRFSALQNHCVTVLGADGNRLLVGDPINGLSSVRTEEFERKWLYVGIVMKRVPSPGLRR